jgi:hypothetical protein
LLIAAGLAGHHGLVVMRRRRRRAQGAMFASLIAAGVKISPSLFFFVFALAGRKQKRTTINRKVPSCRRLKGIRVDNPICIEEKAII